jgi:hypothetical protein
MLPSTQASTVSTAAAIGWALAMCSTTTNDTMDASESGAGVCGTGTGSLCLDWPQQISGNPQVLIGLLGWHPIDSTVTGFIVEVVAPITYSLRVQWHSRVAHRSGVPLAFWPAVSSHMADIHIDDHKPGQATVADLMTLLFAVDASDLLGHPTCRAASVDGGQGGLRRLTCWPVDVRRAVASEIAGPTFTLLALLARQRLAEPVLKRKVPWRALLHAFREPALAGGEEYLALQVLGTGSMPGRRLVGRLTQIGSTHLTDAFVRVAAGIWSRHERRLFEQALTELLKCIFRIQTPSGLHVSIVAPEVWALVVSLAEQTAFLQWRVARGQQCEGISILSLRLSKSFRQLASRLRAQPPSRVRQAPMLLAILRFWSRELFSRLQRQDLHMENFRQECNNLATATEAGQWKTQDLSSLAWDQLCARGFAPGKCEETCEVAVSHALEANLPNLEWSVDVPKEGLACLAAVGLTVLPIACTQDLLREAETMQNCLASSRTYLDGLADGRLKIFSIRGAVCATMAFQFESESWQLTEFADNSDCNLIQMLRSSNCPIWQALREFVRHVAQASVGPV